MSRSREPQRSPDRLATGVAPAVRHPAGSPVAAVALAAGLAWLAVSSTPSGGSAQEAVPSCEVRELSRQRLRMGGESLYVEPQTLVFSSRGVLLAGRPTYLWGHGPGGRRVQVRDSLLGVILGRDGEARAIPKPEGPRWVDDVRGVALGNGGWGLLFTEPPTAEWPPQAPGRAVWYGTFDGARWTSLQRLPVPDPWRIEGDLGSKLVRRGERLAWAARAEHPDRHADEDRVAFFERRDGGWRSRLWPFAASYVELDHSEDGTLVAAVVRPDTALAPPAYDGNSLFLYHPGDRRPELRRIVRGGREPVHAPELRLGPAGALSWISEIGPPRAGWGPPGRSSGAREPTSELRAILDPLAPERQEIVRLDTELLRHVYAPTTDGRRLWITHHASGSVEEMELRVVGLESGAPRRLGHLPYPFEGPFGAVGVGRREILIAGPLVDRNEDVLVTLLLRLRLDC